MGSLLEILSVFLMSTVKFVFGGVPLALGLGFSFFQAVTVTSLGGFVGVAVFVNTSDKLIAYLKKRKILKQLENPNQIRKKSFTRTNKIIIIVKQRFGLLGISLLTPLLLSIPIGCFLAVRYFNDKQKILFYMFGSILFWSVSISSFKLLF
ncbi:MAG: hypothetical protein Q7W13_12330 [Bacteroidia bacterium]|nr:hypothetical protein [Bacteroidia bacterium]